jgi:hypothetical protein
MARGVVLLVIAQSGAAMAEAPPTTPAVTPAPTKLSGEAASKPVVTPTGKPATPQPTAAAKKQLERDKEKEAAAFAAALDPDNPSGGDPTVGSMGKRRSTSEPSAFAVSLTTGHSSTNGGLATSGSKKTPPVVLLKGTATCSVRAVDDTQFDVTKFQNKITAAYMTSVRRCAQGDGTVRVSKTTLTLTVNQFGRSRDIASNGADLAIATCIAKHAAAWRFAPAKGDKTAHRVEVTLETKP